MVTRIKNKKVTDKKQLVKIRRMESKHKTDKHQLTLKEKKILSAIKSAYATDSSLIDCLVDICGNYESILDNSTKMTKAEILEALEQYSSEFSHVLAGNTAVIDKRYDRMKRLIEKE